MIITIDGPAGSGKSTLARNLARELGLIYLDTGATYRAIALAAGLKGLDESNPDELAPLAESSRIELRNGPDDMRVFLDGDDVTDEIRAPEISDLASRISAVPEVRSALVSLQRKMVEGKDTVSEGRDTGTVVFPDADLKIYLDASIEERAKRRAQDWQDGTDLREIMYKVARRDDRDRTRVDSPLKVADNAMIVDSTFTEPEDVLEIVIEALREKGLLPR